MNENINKVYIGKDEVKLLLFEECQLYVDLSKQNSKGASGLMIWLTHTKSILNAFYPNKDR